MSERVREKTKRMKRTKCASFVLIFVPYFVSFFSLFIHGVHFNNNNIIS